MIEKVQEWAKSKGIYEKSSATTQQIMMYIELGEFADEVLKGGTAHNQAMELGDVIVCLINYLTMVNDQVSLLDLHGVLDGDYEYDDSFTRDDLLLGFLYADDITTFINAIIPLYAMGIGHPVSNCLSMAYHKIINRTGEMKNGKFVKSADL